MEFNAPFLLTNILTEEELSSTPNEVQQKFKKCLDEIIDEYCKVKAAGARADDYQQTIEEYESKIADYEVKLKNYEQSVEELRVQLNEVLAERNKSLETVRSYEEEMANLREEKNNLQDEHNSLLQAIDRLTNEQERQQLEIRTYQEQLKSAIQEKCKAISRVDEIESKALALDMKERRMEQERSILSSQIETLTDDLNRSNNDLQALRREHTVQQMQLNTNLTERTEKLKNLQSQCEHYKKMNAELTEKVQDLANKLYKQNEESNKVMEHFKNEVDAKSRIIDLYKSNCNDSVMESNELTTAIAELKRMLSEASEEYGILETKHKATLVSHEEQLDEKEKEIENLRTELKHANDLLKELQLESMDKAISKLAPSAAVASRLIRADMSLTELYSLYVKSTEELGLLKRENARLQLQLKTIVSELSENAPMLQKQEIELAKLIESNNIIIHQRDELLAEKENVQLIIDEKEARINQLEREQNRHKRTEADMSRQICYLLQENSRLRVGGSASNENNATVKASYKNTEEIITNHLVTFSDITELQTNNKKLLLLVRNLSSKLEQMEEQQQKQNFEANQQQLEKQLKKVQQMQQTLDQQQTTIGALMSKADRYKQLYFKLRGQKSKDSESSEDEYMDTNDTQKSEGGSKLPANEHERPQSKRIQDLEHELKQAKEQYKTLKEQHEYYFQEKKNNDKIMNEQFDSMRSEVRQLTADNCKLMSGMEHSKEQIKIQEKNICTYKKQISALEERTKNYEKAIVKHEQTINYLRTELMKEHTSSSSVQSELNHLQHENRLLKDTSMRLQAEKEAYQREHQQQNLLLSNLEIIKSNLERSETEGRLRIEHQLEETVRELSAQRRRFQENEDRMREISQDLQRQTETAKQRAEEERQQADKLRQEIQTVRNELNAKCAQVDMLSKKLQDSLIPSKHENPITLANKRAREFEVKYEELKIEFDALTAELSKTREHSDQYYRLSQSAEHEIKKLDELHTAYVAKAEAELQNLRLSEQNLKSKLIELESEIQLSSIAEHTGTNQSDEQKKLQEELREALQKLKDCQRDLCNVRNEKQELAELLHAAETKYANEMMLHSSDIQSLTATKSEHAKLQNEINKLQLERDSAVNQIDDVKAKYEERIKLLQTEHDEMEQRVLGLDQTNRNLHEQIEALSSKLTVLSQNNTLAGGSLNSTRNESGMLNVSDLNLSQRDEEGRSLEQWLQIVKFMRKEKDLTLAKMDIIKAENTRLVTEHSILQKKLEEFKGIINQQQNKSETVINSALRHEEVLRKIETLDALSDSNRILREERNTLAERVKQLNERLSELETQLFPMQNKTRELTAKVDELSTENTSLRSEAIKWRQRANALVEKSNKNPEEFKRLQIERENLTKLLAAEKEQMRHLHEELNALRMEKSRVDAENATLLRQLQAMNEEKRKITEDLSSGKQQTVRLMQEIMELKNKLLQREEATQKLSEELESKEVQLQDSKSKEIQIRKIAKRYKDSYLELSAANTNAENSSATGDLATPSGAVADATVDPATVENLNSVIQNMQEAIEKLRKENEELKSQHEMDDRTKTLLHDTTQRLLLLKESNDNINQELDTAKSKLKTSIETQELIKAQFDQTNKQLEEQLTANKENMARLARDNESLQMRINQLQRQLGLQQSNKPSTSSSGAGIDKGGMTDSSPRTANVKPMSGSSSVQQSATVTPWRGSETPLASIRPISVQNSRTAAILPTSQQAASGGSSTSASSATSASCSAAASSASNSSTNSSATANTALVPPQQQVHTTGSSNSTTSSSNLESMSASPTSSHADYIPSTSSASVTVATIPPMGAASVAESSQEAESGGSSSSSSQQQQAVALVSPRVEGGANLSSTPNQLLDASNSNQQQQPSTSGSTSAALSSHSRHTPSSSSVTTSQSPSASSATHKRPREMDGDSSTSTEEHAKRTRCSMLHTGEVAAVVAITDSGTDVEYQVPTSSQRDQEDDIVVVDSEDDDAMGEADDGPAEGAEAEDNEEEGYEDSYEQEDQGVEDHDDDAVLMESRRLDIVEVDNNEVDIDEVVVNIAPSEATAGGAEASVSQQHDNQSQQSQTISSGSQETAKPSIAGSSSSGKQASAEMAGSSPQMDNANARSEDKQAVVEEENVVGGTEDYAETDSAEANKDAEQRASKEKKQREEADEDFNEEEESVILIEENGSGDADNIQGQQEVQPSEAEGTTEDNECADGVSSEGEKQTVEMEEEGREAEASTSPTINTRSKSGSRGTAVRARQMRGIQRGQNRPTPIVWKETPTHSRNLSPSQRNPEQSTQQAMRGFPNQRTPRGRRMRRPTGNNYGNMRFS